MQRSANIIMYLASTFIHQLDSLQDFIEKQISPDNDNTRSKIVLNQSLEYTMVEYPSLRKLICDSKDGSENGHEMSTAGINER